MGQAELTTFREQMAEHQNIPGTYLVNAAKVRAGAPLVLTPLDPLLAAQGGQEGGADQPA